MDGYLQKLADALKGAYSGSVDRASDVMGQAANYRQSLAQMLDPQWQAQMKTPESMADFDQQSRDVGLSIGGMLGTMKPIANMTKSAYQAISALKTGGEIRALDGMTQMPNKAVAQVNSNPNLTVRTLEDGGYLLRHDPMWGNNSKPFYSTGDDIGELMNAGINMVQKSDSAMQMAQKRSFDNSLLGRLQNEYGDTFQLGASTQSNSKYLTHSPSGLKIRISDHDLPLHYEQPDVDLRTWEPIESQIAQIKKALE